jgi:hypothetical protein
MRRDSRVMHRRGWLLLPLALVAGCSGTKKGKSAKKSRGPSGNHTGKRKKPKTMANLLIDGYIADLKQGPVAKQITAARELGNMGATAKSALPALEPLARHADASLSAAAKQAITSIKK